MTQLLSFEEWKEKYFNNSPEFRNQVTKSGEFTEEQLNELLNNAAKFQYDVYHEAMKPLLTQDPPSTL